MNGQQQGGVLNYKQIIGFSRGRVIYLADTAISKLGN